MEILLEIETHDRQLVSAIIGQQQAVSKEKTVNIPGNAILKAKGIAVRKAFGLPETLEFVLSFGSGVASGIVANWIFQKIKGRATAFKIDRVEVKLNKGDIERVLIEKIREVS